MVGLAEIVKGEAEQYLQTHYVTSNQRKAMSDIVSCRTEAMGAVTNTCEACGAEYRLFRSCRNRSCPQCQNEAREKWFEARRQEILPVEYLQVVFTPPAELKLLGRYCPAAFYDAVIRAAGQTIIDVGRSRLHAKLGCLVQLQTWGRSMAMHPHAHCVVPCGGFSEDGNQWISFGGDELPAETLSNRFRSLLCENIRAAARQGRFGCLPEAISVEQVLATARNRKWRVYAEPPFGGAERLLRYLSRYTYRVAITNGRIRSYDIHQVTFRWGNGGDEETSYTLEGQEFLRRFLMHVPPKGFVRIRSYGFLANRNRTKNLEKAGQLVVRQERNAGRLSERLRPVRLCPACSAKRRNGRMPHFAPSPELSLQLPFSLRSPPTDSAAA